MRFGDIPLITQASYKVNISIRYLEKQLQEYIENYGLELTPNFQRAHVWTEEQQTSYLEWILRGGKSGLEILFNCPGWSTLYTGKMQLVDGLQRITAVRKFLNNEIPAFGTLYKDYEDSPRAFLIGFVFHVNDLETEEEVLQWYLDINSGGTPHTEEELEKVRKMLEEEKENGKKA